MYCVYVYNNVALLQSMLWPSDRGFGVTIIASDFLVWPQCTIAIEM